MAQNDTVVAFLSVLSSNILITKNMIQITREQFKSNLKRWIDNHPDVFDKHSAFGEDHYWYIQNCIGDLFHWDEDIVDILTEISEETDQIK